MKFVFIANSHTTLLTSLGTIKYLNIDAQDVIIMFIRNMKASYIPDVYKTIRADNEYLLVNNIWECKNKKEIKRRIKVVDDMTERLIGEQYQLFISHLGSALFLLMYNHPLCVKVSYVQEGAYTIPKMFVNRVPFYIKLKKKIGCFRRYRTQRLYGIGKWYYDGVLRHQKTIDAYAFSADFYKYLDCNLHIVTWPQINFQFNMVISGPVFIFDGFVRNNQSEPEYYLKQCDLMIQRFHGQKNFIKFHPAQSEEEREAILGMFKSKKISFEIIDDSTPFELCIINYKNMTVVGMGSSLLYYAKDMGHKVICCDTWMFDSPKYMDNHNLGVPIFHEYYNEEDVPK